MIWSRLVEELPPDRWDLIGAALSLLDIREYVTHYHAERNHQGFANTRIAPSSTRGTSRIGRSKRIGGMLNYYYREAA